MRVFQGKKQDEAVGKDPHRVLEEFKATGDFFIGLDSDGCAFDNMEIKHKQCFCPQAVKFFALQPVEQYAREAWDFVNLYSKMRGCNRFLGLIHSLDLLRERNEVRARELILPDLTPLVEWTRQETKLGNAALKSYALKAKNAIIDTTLAWSLAVNESIADMTHDIPPFPFVQESLALMQGRADVMVVSSAPCESLQREWGGYGIEKYVCLLAGQEYGSKSEQVGLAASGKYEPGKVLIIGDAPGDLAAAQDSRALFYPIIPGKERASWERFYRQALARFFRLEYAGEYEEMLLKEFDASLPALPPWKR